MTRVKIFLGSAVLAAGVAVGGSVSPAAAGPAAAPPFAAPPAFVQGPPVDLQTPGATICTPSWGSIVLPFCV